MKWKEQILKQRLTYWILISGLAAVISLATYSGPASSDSPSGPSPFALQDNITGQWLLELTPGADSARITINRNYGGHGHSSNSFDLPLASIRGLNQSQAGSSGSAVKFEVAADAGTFSCEGWFKEGNGSGHFTFAPNQAFASEMRGLGYDNLTSEDLFSMAMHGVTRAFIGELKSLGYDHVALDQLIALRIHGVTTSFIRELNGMGYEHVPTDELVSMRIHGVNTDFIKGLTTLGYARVPIDQLVSMRIHGVSADYIRKLKDRGLSNLTIDQLIDMKIHGQ